MYPFCVSHSALWKFGVLVWLFEKKGAQTNEVSVMAFRGGGSYKNWLGQTVYHSDLVTHWYLLSCSDEWRGYVNNKSQEIETCASTSPLSIRSHSVFYSLCCKRQLYLLRVKKIQQPQIFLFVFPLKIWLQTSVFMHLLSWPKLNFGCYLTFEIIF